VTNYEENEETVFIEFFVSLPMLMLNIYREPEANIEIRALILNCLLAFYLGTSYQNSIIPHPPYSETLPTLPQSI